MNEMDDLGDNGEADDFVDHGLAADGDPGGAAASMAASVGGDLLGDGDQFQAQGPGDDEVPAATADDPVAALATEAAPF